MVLSWENIDQLEDFKITYLLYQEGKNIEQISKIRNMKIDDVNRDIIKYKQFLNHIRNNNKTIIDILLEEDKDSRIDIINSLNENELNNVKKLLYKRILVEKNVEDFMILLWICGELKDCRLLDIVHTYSKHPHGGVRRMAYSAMGKLGSDKSIDYLHKGLIDAKPQVRQYAAKSLCKIGNEVTLKKLKNLINNPNEKEYVKRAFLEAIDILENIKNKN
ncbi:HEAT repeat domain-containing protein [Tepidibacter hydrothermalis]|uniref:HEAT repeat domain-containing protein n=1 Tax=Tepidibacter hydrothermalis TaxID=3036126 RepID=A0ABY8E8V5_9FIRM|nr:HEAT repeat domain-containing protein [Tepidibacter hydrothermalis]WFD09307.1 HEAT repeat domain-containing protein [Tepidibacter hydrothermalis]